VHILYNAPPVRYICFLILLLSRTRRGNEARP